MPDPIPTNDNVHPPTPPRPPTPATRPVPGPSRPSRSHPWLILIALMCIGSIVGIALLVSNSDSGQSEPPPPANDTPSTEPETTAATTNSPKPQTSIQSIAWSQTAQDFESIPDGKKINVDCPPAGEAATIYGTDLYTDDSSICTAAVHVGAITFEIGGKVTIAMKPGASQYSGSARNGVTSNDWDSSWGRSFVVLMGGSPPRPTYTSITWDDTTQNYNDQVGKRLVFKCPPNGEARSIWGTDRYTDDSSVCTAGVHAGKISFQRGGTVSVIIRKGASKFVGSTRNGVTSSDYGEWPRSFEVVG
jgi:LCCL domain